MSIEHAHPGQEFAKSPDFKLEPEEDHCHVYFVHQDGKIYWKPNVRIPKDSELSVSEGDTFCGHDRLTLMSVICNISIRQDSGMLISF